MSKLLDHLTTRQYLPLFVAMLATLLLRPVLLQAGVLTYWLYYLFLLFIVLGSLRAIWGHTFTLIWVMGLALTGAILSRAGQADSVVALGHSLSIAFECGVVVLIFLHLLRMKRVTEDGVYGAACVYLLFAFIFAQVYKIIELAAPGSFQVTKMYPADAEAGAVIWSVQENLPDMLDYFSLITLSTVGYGDIVPLSPSACFLSALEGVVGQLFLAIMLARMVGLYIAHASTGTAANKPVD